MACGVGVRLTEYGSRIVKLDRNSDGITLTDLAAGSAEANMASFTQESGITVDDCTVVFGLGPGDFLSACLTIEPEMQEASVREQLRWELEQKMLSKPDEYSFDYALAGSHGFGFAGRSSRIQEKTKSHKRVLADVEPVALFNCCEEATDIESGCTMILSIEAEGITVVVTDAGLPVVMDAAVYRDQEIAMVLAGLDRKRIAALGEDETSRLNGYVRDSIDRLTAFGGNESLPSPVRLILAGCGGYINRLPGMIERQYGLTPVLVDPFSAVTNDVNEIHPELAGMGAAFSTSFGLALRALEV